MFHHKDVDDQGHRIVKQSIYRLPQRLTFIVLISLYLFFLARYIFWWFQPNHMPHNWGTFYLHTIDYLIFALLSFVVFIGATQRIANLFALWFAAKPLPQIPQQGLRVAFLTCFVPGKEPIEMLVNTLAAMKQVRYPHDTWILDEGDSNEVKQICSQLGVYYFTRKGIEKYNQEMGKFRTKTKAGNHNSWRDLYEKYYDFVAQIDMDHVPEPDYFEKTLGYFNDPSVGFVGMPQFYKNTENWIARGAAEQAYFFHGPMQQGFYGCDMPFLIGTSHITRTSAMNQIGGYAPTIVEDHLTGMKFYEYGWKGVYVPEILVKGEGPLNWVDYFNQQMRWSYGLFEILFKFSPKILGRLKWRQKINYFLAQLYYFTGVAVVIGMVLTFIYLVFGIRSANMSIWQWLVFAIPPFLISNAIQIYFHRFSIDPEKEPVFGLLGMFLNLGANLIYAIAFVKFLTGQKLRYMVTQKGSTAHEQKIPLSTFTLHLVFADLMLAALIASFFNQHTAVQLRFWALFNFITLFGVALSAYSAGLSAKLSFLHNLKVARPAFSIALGSALIIGLVAAYPQYGGVVKAVVDKQIIQSVVEQPIAGKVLPPNQGAYLGVSLYQHNDTDELNSVQTLTGKKFVIVGFYQSWGVEENQFNTDWANNISEDGAIPLITWEPWAPVSGFDRSESKVDQKDYRLINIINGGYDNYIKQYALAVKSYKKPVMIRFAQEMNGNWYPWGSTFNSPEEYVLAWRHVHEIFDNTGATNVTWVWSPNEIYADLQVPYANQIDLFYPGDDYVDWVGFSAFNWAGIYKNNFWRSPEDLYTYSVSELRKFNKPIMITETASAESLTDNTAKGQWIAQLSKYLENNTDIRGVVWFNTKDNGIDWSLNSSQQSIDSFKQNFDSYFNQSPIFSK